MGPGSVPPLTRRATGSGWSRDGIGIGPASHEAGYGIGVEPGWDGIGPASHEAGYGRGLSRPDESL